MPEGQRHLNHPGRCRIHATGKTGFRTRRSPAGRQAATAQRSGAGYLPKGTDFRKVTDAEVRAVQDRTDARPRRCLGYLTPAAFRRARPP